MGIVTMGDFAAKLLDAVFCPLDELLARKDEF
jgi:hypothetical protein